MHSDRIVSLKFNPGLEFLDVLVQPSRILKTLEDVSPAIRHELGSKCIEDSHLANEKVHSCELFNVVSLE